MLNHIENNIFPFRFRCVKCGICCENLSIGVPLFYKDIERIASYENLNLNDFLIQYCKLVIHNVNIKKRKIEIPVLYLKTSKRRCVFYEDKNCLVHKVKPYLCSSSPFVSLLFQDDNFLEFFKNNCKGFGRGAYHSKERIKQILKQEVKLEGKEWKLFKNGLYNNILNLSIRRKYVGTRC